jgi:sugar phosphate isomerase/epimerase
VALTRRDFLAAPAGLAAGLCVERSGGAAPTGTPRTSLGVVEHSFGIRFSADRSPRGRDPIAFVEYCAGLGAGGVQLAVGARDPAYTARLRETVEAHGMYLEGSVRFPLDRGDTDRFAAEVRTAKDAGATVVRTAVLGGRRYETFASAAAFREFARRGFESLTLAEPVVARQRMNLAVENHKDWRVDELVGMLKRLDSRHVGACVDTGNSIALLEDPMGVVEALAPWAFSTHLKDMGVEEYRDGFLLSEVPLGDGFLDLGRIVAVLRKARPEVRFSLEMITRDPLKVPCLTDAYWATFDGVPGRDLARTLALVRSHPPKQPLPRVSPLTAAEKLEAEEANVRRCLAFAAEHLGLAPDPRPRERPRPSLPR